MVLLCQVVKVSLYDFQVLQTVNKYFVMWFFMEIFGPLQNLQTLYNEFDPPVYNSSKSAETLKISK